MTCEDFELSLGEPALSPAAEAHRAECPSCREAHAAVALAALPEPPLAEETALRGLEAAVLAEWRARARWRDRVARVAGLALAAGVGALVATGVLWTRRAEPTTPVAQRPLAAELVALDAPVVPDFSASGFDLADDEVSFEVSWPEVTEGEL
jgi:hypothetical protein